ncbi:acyltransferase family protein [Marinomonas primoryensis]|uniref:acyltransferase family protein n=1 Tax=Marinomonas primoryensis TaxID=178399 RepID=UPI0019551ABA|nr:acyltransferase family protein [Marinomonas primoryensis]
MLLPTTGAALLILQNANNRLTQLLSGRIIVWIGALSYSLYLYLWHWLVLAFMRYYTDTEMLSWQYSLAFIAIILALAATSFYWIETPLRFKHSKKQSIGYVGLVAVVVLTVVGMRKINAYYTPEKIPVEYTRYADPKTICHGEIIGDCLKGDLNSDKEILVLGNSHAAMLNHFFDYLGKELGFKARIITASSCVTIPGFDYQRLPEWAHKSCTSQIEEVKRHLDQAEIIFLAAFWSRQLESQEFNQALIDFLQEYAPNVRKYIISQESLLNRHPLRNQRFIYIGLDAKTTRNNDYILTNLQLKNLAESIEKSYYLELDKLDMFNQAPIYNERLMYFDEHHLNELGAIEYAKLSKKKLEK